jgi:hypothetical protein
VVDWIQSHATEAHIPAIIDAINNRQRANAAARAAAVENGQDIEIGHIKQRYLAGLRGTVVQKDARNAEIELDEDSTERLRWDRKNKTILVPPDVKRFNLPDVPLGCCIPR